VRRKIGGEMAAEEGVIGFLIQSSFKGGFDKVRAMARRVTPRFMDQWASFP
jgi:hypothetical protein